MASTNPKTKLTRRISYELEKLFVDQDEDFVVDCIAPVLAWVPGRSKPRSRQPFAFPVEWTVGRKTRQTTLALSWNLEALTLRVPGVEQHATRLAGKRSPQREHVTELAAYGLSLVAISVLFPGRRVIGFNNGAAPDILFDPTPNAIRGVEAAGRSRGGRNALLAVRTDKLAPLLVRTDIAELHLSLWCASARQGIMEQVR